MKTLDIGKFGNAVRLSALYGSALAALLFGIAFATDKLLYSHYAEIFSGRSDHFGVRLFLSLLVGVFICYLLAVSKRLAVVGSLLAICAVGAILAWFQSNHNSLPNPFLAVLALPAMLHLMAVLSESRSGLGEVVSLPGQAGEVVGASEAA